MDKRKLSQESSPSAAEVSRGTNRNSNTSATVTLEVLHQLAASYFTDRESTLRRLHHLQIASTAIRVRGSQETVNTAAVCCRLTTYSLSECIRVVPPQCCGLLTSSVYTWGVVGYRASTWTGSAVG